MLIEADHSHLIVIDVQQKLVPAMSDGDRMIANCARLMQGARVVGVPVTVSEQYPQGLGPTVDALSALAGDDEVFAKTHFSCAGDADLAVRVDAARRRHLILCGIEAHVCVLQSALGFQGAGYRVSVVVDAVTSRAPESVRVAMRRLDQANIAAVTVEMVLFEWTEKADSPVFKQMRPLIQ